MQKKKKKALLAEKKKECLNMKNVCFFIFPSSELSHHHINAHEKAI